MPNTAKIFSTIIQPTRVLSDYLVISCLDSGRWAISKDLVLLDTKTMRRYLPGNLDKNKVHYKDIPDLVENGRTIYANYLLALALRPLYLPRDIILDPVRRPALHITGGTWTARAEQVFWQYPKGGIAHANPTLPYLYVPGIPDVLVDPAGTISRVVDAGKMRELTSDTQGSNILFLTWPGNTTPMQISAARLMMLAHGEYSATNLAKDIYYRDGMETNYARANLITTPEDLINNAVEATVDMVTL